jgi:hypothetical protein
MMFREAKSAAKLGESFGYRKRRPDSACAIIVAPPSDGNRP